MGGSYFSTMAFLPFSKFTENLSVTSLIAFSQAAVGLGVGLLIAEKMDRGARQKAAIGLLGAGSAIILPFAAGVYQRFASRPESSREMRRRLNSIRRNVGYDGDDRIY